MIEERCLLAAFGGGGLVEIIGEDGGDGAIIEGADFDSAGRYGLRPRRLDATIQPQDTKAGPEALLWMRPVDEDRGDEPLGVWADGPGPAAKALGAPFGVAAVGRGHVIGLGAVPAPAIAALMRGYALPSMEYFDDARSETHIDFGADQRARHRII